jgi:RimJ/RimL family protein N-acetyltransferase
MAWTFKKITDADLPILLTWFKEPHVQKWWPIPTQDEVLAHFLKRIRSKDTFGYLAQLDGNPIGYIQYYYLDTSEAKTGAHLPVELPETSVGTDQFIGDPNYLYKGYGTQFIKAFIDYLRIIEPQVTTIIVDPEPTNTAAIRCYEKVGFKRVTEYDTPYGRALLMRYDVV